MVTVRKTREKFGSGKVFAKKVCQQVTNHKQKVNQSCSKKSKESRLPAQENPDNVGALRRRPAKLDLRTDIRTRKFGRRRSGPTSSGKSRLKVGHPSQSNLDAVGAVRRRPAKVV